MRVYFIENGKKIYGTVIQYSDVDGGNMTIRRLDTRKIIVIPESRVKNEYRPNIFRRLFWFLNI